MSSPTELVLSDGCTLTLSRLPAGLIWDNAAFDQAWDLHPADRHVVRMWGRETPVARWQQAYGANYTYSGSRNNALPFPDVLRPLLNWARATVDARLNGILLNWYEGPQSQITAHSDEWRRGELLDGAPIVTISFGETRTFRLHPGPEIGGPTVNIPVDDGAVIVMPAATNKAWKHSVPKRAAYVGRRVSVTLRAFHHVMYD